MKIINIRAVFFTLGFAVLLKGLYLLSGSAMSGLSGKSYDVTSGDIHAVFMKHDSWWYKQVAEEGYREIREKKEIGFSEKSEFTQSEWAFFPFYPVLTAVVMKCGISWEWSALVISLLAAWMTFLLFYYLSMRWTGGDLRKSIWMTLFFGLFPFNFYFSMYYTEALFFVLMAGSFWAIYERKYAWLWVLLPALILTRPNGLVLLLPLLLFFLEKEKMLEGARLKWGETKIRSLWPVLGAMVVAVLAFIGFCWFQLEKTGFYRAFSIAQAGWYRELTWPFMSFFRHGDFATQFNSWYTLVILALAVLAWKKLPLSLNVLVWISLLLPLCSNSVLSMPRFVSILFPLFLVYGEKITQFRMRNAILLLVLAFHLWSFVPWLSESVLGM